eukprot:s238_g23.t1
MASVERKRRKLDVHAPRKEQFDVLRSNGISSVDSRKVIQCLHEEDKGRWTCEKPNLAYAKAFPCYDTMQIKAADGSTTIDVPIMKLSELLQAKVDACPLYSAMLLQAMELHQNRLTLLFYCDEVSGGNVLSALQSRKSNLCYVSWLQCPLLFQENMWLTVSVAKSSCIQSLPHGMAELIRRILEHVRENSQHGIPLSFGHDVRLLWIDQVMVIADAEAIRSSTGAKGAAGLKPCLQCLNVLQLNKAKDVPGHVDITSMDPTEWWPQTTASIESAVRELRAAGGVVRTQETEKFLGWHFQNLPHGPLQSPSLQGWVSIENFMFDAMHIMWSNGIVCQEVGLWFSALLEKTTTTLECLQKYAALWQRNAGTAAAHLPACLSQLFSSKLCKESHDYKGDAMYTAAVLPLCVAFCDEVLHDVEEMRVPNASLLALHRVATCLWSLKVSVANVDQLLPLQKQFLQCHQTAYGSTQMRPKHHYGLHLTQQIQKVTKVIDCFCCERKHKGYKSLAQRKSFFAPAFSKTCLLELVTHELHSSMDASILGTCLLGSSQSKTLPGFGSSGFFAQGLEMQGVKYVTKQFVQLTPACAVQVHGAWQCHQTFYLQVKVFQASLRTKTGRTAWISTNENMTLVASSDVKPINKIMFHRKDDNKTLWLMS